MANCMPIVEVNDENFERILPTVKTAIKDAAFIAIDLELTGLGNRKKLNYPEIDLRYKYTSEIARNYAVISLGLSCFTCRSVSDVTVDDNESSDENEHIRTHNYLVQTFDFISLCTEDFSIEVKSHKFLRSHGFDFNKLYSSAIMYHKGCDYEKEEFPNLREVLTTLVKYPKPIVLHNGFVDLAFLYQAFYADLPKKSESFAADLNEMFPCGVYDTKYISEFHQSMPATYLEYLYKKMQLKNASRGARGDWHVRLQFPPYPSGLPHIDWHPYLQILQYDTKTDDDSLELCESFSFHGWCSKNDKCNKSHNINKIVTSLQPLGSKNPRNQRYSGPVSESIVQALNHMKKDVEENCSMESNEPHLKRTKKSSLPETEKSKSENGVAHSKEISEDVQSNQYSAGHRAGFDSFMTGFLFAFYVSEQGKLVSSDEPFTSDCLGLHEQVNKIYLMGKNIPFLVRTGTYASTSQNHQKKIVKIRKDIAIS